MTIVKTSDNNRKNDYILNKPLLSFGGTFYIFPNKDGDHIDSMDEFYGVTLWDGWIVFPFGNRDSDDDDAWLRVYLYKNGEEYETITQHSINSVDSIASMYLNGDILTVNYTYSSVGYMQKLNLSTQSWTSEEEGNDTTGVRILNSIEYSGYSVEGYYDYISLASGRQLYPILKFTSKY